MNYGSLHAILFKLFFHHIACGGGGKGEDDWKRVPKIHMTGFSSVWSNKEYTDKVFLCVKKNRGYFGDSIE